MENFMQYLLTNIPFLADPLVEWVFDTMVLCIPLVLVPQFAFVISIPKEAQNVSVFKYFCFLLIQILVAVKTTSTTLLVSMAICAFESLLIIIIVIVRRRDLQRWRRILTDKATWEKVGNFCLAFIFCGTYIFCMALLATVL